MVESLREVPLFADLSGRDLKRLADSMRERVRETQARKVAATG